MNLFLNQQGRSLQDPFHGLSNEEAIRKAFRLIRINQFGVLVGFPIVAAILLLTRLVHFKGSNNSADMFTSYLIAFGSVVACAILFAWKVFRDATAAIPQITTRTQQLSVALRSAIMVNGCCGAAAAIGLYLQALAKAGNWPYIFIALTPIMGFLLAPSQDHISQHLRPDA